MKISPISSIECVVLHDRFEPVDGGRLFEFIQTYAANSGFNDRCNLMVTATEKDIHVMAGDVRIMVSQNEQPLAVQGFASAVGYPATQMMLPDAGEIVRRHQANTFITIGKGAVDMMAIAGDEAGALMKEVVGEKTAFNDWEEVNPVMELVEALVDFIIYNNPASAIHWCPSDHLISEHYFKTVLATDMPQLLYIRPQPFSSTGRLGEDQPIGMMAVGSQYLIGKLVTIEEAKVPLDWLVERVSQFVAMCQMRGGLIADGETYSVDETEIISVRHTGPTDAVPYDQIKLEVVRCDQFGIMNEHLPQLHVEYDTNGDVAKISDEPVIAPVQDGVNGAQVFIVDVEGNASGRVVEAVDDADAIESGPMSVSQLRKIARSASENRERIDSQTKSTKVGNVFDKVISRFGVG